MPRSRASNSVVAAEHHPRLNTTHVAKIAAENAAHTTPTHSSSTARPRTNSLRNDHPLGAIIRLLHNISHTTDPVDKHRPRRLLG